MSKAVPLKLSDKLFDETQNIIKKIHVSRNSYVNEAIKYYNRVMKRKLLKEQYSKESALVGKHSLKINNEFQEIEDDILGLWT